MVQIGFQVAAPTFGDYQVAGADFQVAGAISTFGGDFILSVQNPPFPYYLEVQRGNPGTVKAASWI
jgi:hypothetical protein